MLHGLTGQAHAGRVDFGHFAAQAMPGQPEAVGAKGIGFKNLCAGLEILFVNREDQAGVGEVQLVVAAVDGDAAGVEHGAHRAVGEHGAAGEDVGELRHSLAMLSHRAVSRQWAGLLCYTSGVIYRAETGFGQGFSICPIDRQPSSIRSRRGRGPNPRHAPRIASR